MYGIMLLGRFIFGLVGETLWMVQIKDQTTWFMEYEYNIAIGLSNGIGGFSNYYSGSWVPEYY